MLYSTRNQPPFSLVCILTYLKLLPVTKFVYLEVRVLGRQGKAERDVLPGGGTPSSMLHHAESDLKEVPQYVLL